MSFPFPGLPTNLGSEFYSPLPSKARSCPSHLTLALTFTRALVTPHCNDTFTHSRKTSLRAHSVLPASPVPAQRRTLGRASTSTLLPPYLLSPISKDRQMLQSATRWVLSRLPAEREAWASLSFDSTFCLPIPGAWDGLGPQPFSVWRWREKYLAESRGRAPGQLHRDCLFLHSLSVGLTLKHREIRCPVSIFPVSLQKLYYRSRRNWGCGFGPEPQACLKVGLFGRPQARDLLSGAPGLGPSGTRADQLPA